MLPSARLIRLAFLLPLPFLLLVLHPGAWPLGLAVDLLFLAALVIDWKTLRSLPPSQAERLLPDAMTEDRPSKVTLVVQNPSDLPLFYDLADHYPAAAKAEPSTFSSLFQPKERLSFLSEITPEKRGRLTWGPIEIRSRTSWGLFERREILPAEKTLRIYPKLTALQKDRLAARAETLARIGLKASVRKGKGTEFEQLREYTQGDDYRDIHWKATARRGQPITKVYQVERSQQILIVLDFGRTMAGTIGISNQTRLDIAIEATLTLCQIAQRFEDRFGLLLFSHRPETFLPPSHGRGHYQKILHAVHDLQPLPYDIQYRDLFYFLATRHRKRSLILFFTDLEDEEASDQLQEYLPLLLPTHLPLCISIADPALLQIARQPVASESSLFLRTAALELLAHRDHRLSSLRRQGVLLLDRPPSEITSATISQYLDIKTKHLL